jgi:hypothetical protein
VPAVAPQPPVIDNVDIDLYPKSEPLDPLKLDLGAEELDMKPEVQPVPEVSFSQQT